MNVRPRLASRFRSGFSRRKIRHLVAIVSVGAVVAAGWGGAVEGDRYDLLSGTIWMPSKVGQVTLLSGASSRPMASVGVAAGDAQLSVSQSGSDAIVVDHGAGTVRRVSGSTFDAERPVRFADDGSRLQVFVNGTHMFVLDGARGVVYKVDPVTLRVVDSAMTLEAEVGHDAAVVDNAGRLWAIDTRTGDLAWVDGKTSHRRPSGRPGTGTLVTVAGSPVLVAGGQAQWLDDDGQSSSTVDLGLRPREDAVVSGTATGELLVVLGKRGVLKLCTDSGCVGAAYPLPPGHAFGPAVNYQGRLVVPDFTSGTVLIFSPDGAQPVRTEVLKPAASFGLEVRDTILFYNDTASDRAGVIRVDGSRTEIRKYDPQHPGASVDKGTKNVQPPQIAPPKTSVTSPRDTPAQAKSKSSGDPSQPADGGRAGRDGPGAGQGSAGQSGSQGGSTGTPTPPPSQTQTEAPPPDRPTSAVTAPPAVFHLVGFTVAPNPVVVGGSVSVSGVRVTGGDVRRCQWRIDPSSVPVPCASLITAPATGTHQVLVDVVSATGSPASATLGLQVRAPAGDPFQILYVGLSSATVSTGDSVRVNPGFTAGPPKQCTWTVGAAPALGCDAATTAAAPGTYRVTIRATSTAGLELTKSTTLTVTSPVPPPPDKPGKPVIAQPAGCLTANANVSVSATPPAGAVDSWHWQVDGREVASTGATLSFHSSVSASNKQLVSVYVSNSAGDSPLAIATICLADRTAPLLSVRLSSGVRVHSITRTVTLSATDEESPVSTSLEAWFEIIDECSDPPVSRVEHRSDVSSVSVNGGSCADISVHPPHITPNEVTLLSYKATATSAGGEVSLPRP